MRIFQYWDTGRPPDEVAAWVDGFRAMNPEMKHRLFDRDRASWFIGKHLGPTRRRAFEACAVPAMQSDYFRLCAVLARGGVYADADLQCRAPLLGLLGKAPHAMMLLWNGAMTHGLMMFRRPGDPFLEACLKLATENIEGRCFDSSYVTAGPPVPNAVRRAVEPGWGGDELPAKPWMAELTARARASVAKPAKVAASIEALTLIHTLAAQNFIGTPEPAYKATGAHWLHWEGSIYRDEI